MPDNWNILASLLGTPRPPEPPAADSSNDERTAKANEAEPKTASQPRSFVEKMTDKISDFVRGEDEFARSQRTGSKPAATTGPPVDDVLQALTSVQPPPKLPGFGVQRETETVSDVGFGRREAEIQSRERQLSAGRDESPARQREERQRRGPQDAHPPRARRGGGFASGLGLDIADDEDLRGVKEGALPLDDDATISGENLATQALEPSSRPDPNSRRSAPARERTDRGRPNRNDQRSGPPPRRESAFVDDSDDEEVLDDPASESLVEEGALDSSTRPSGRRRRGRRGQRQRMSIDELDEVVESDVTDSDEGAPPMIAQADATEGERRGRRRRGGRGGRGRDRENSTEETPKGRSETARGPASSDRGSSRSPSVTRSLDAVRHEPPPTKTSLWGDDDVDDELEPFDRPEVDLFDDSEEIVSSRPEAPDEDEGPSAGRRRSRRGGRRRGRGGASRTESDAAQPSGRGTSSRSNADLDDEPLSEFDDEDDLLDDELVSREGRSRRSQTRTDQAPPRNAQRGREDSRSRSESRPAPERADVESGSRSKPIPTWKEIVNLMVDGNLKNRGGGRGPRPSGGGGQSGGSRRR